MRLPQLRDADVQNVERMVENAAATLDRITKTIVKRTPAEAVSSSTCSPGNNSAVCQKPTAASDTQTLPIVLGVVIPLGIALLVLLFLHRRHVKKQRLEDINDPHKSLDFGMGGVGNNHINKRGKPEMSVAALAGHPPRPGHKAQGLSMDMGISSPYLLPAGLNSSRESLHSMARSQHDEHDPYRPVTMLRPSGDNDSFRSGRPRDEKASLYSMSTGHHSNTDKAGLLSNARPMSQSYPKRVDPSQLEPMPPNAALVGQMNNYNGSNPSTRKQSSASEKPLPNPTAKDTEPFPQLAFPEPAAQAMPPPRTSSAAVNQEFPPRKASKSAQSLRQTHQSTHSSHYGEDGGLEDEPPLPPSKDTQSHYDIDPDHIYAERFSVDDPTHLTTGLGTAGLHAPTPVAAQRLSVMGLRPLPADLPDDNPEQRANRIRSFYKEYFDDSKPNPANAQYEEDYGADFLGGGAIYDPDTGGFITGSRPFAQPVGRRAMTPPPRGPPRSNVSSAMGQRHQRKLSTQSAGRLGPRGRAQSAPRKKLPPPMPLHSLPTPFALKSDIEVFGAIDFAPPSSYRQQQNGSRPQTPAGGVDIPYSPMVRSFTPLASSFDHLAVMPSPHELRKSGTFTALDFAPPSRLKDPALLSAPGSDAGSIRSNRSGISMMQSEAIRAGAYRVSRIPKGMVTTKEDIVSQLRPKMDMISPA